MPKIRKILKIFHSRATLEGAGVKLKRAFANNEVTLFDPFLLLDDFRANHSEDYIQGFPWHPHRGIETITYVLKGSVEHGDSMGNKGIIGPGDVQWMTAGSGIIHQEMPKPDSNDSMGGFQLWANLPASHKMMKPRYQEIKASTIPEVSPSPGVKIRLICGEVNGKKGPVKDIIIDPEYLDVTLDSNTSFVHRTKAGHTVFAYVTEGNAQFFPDFQSDFHGNGTLILYEDGNKIEVSTKAESVRFLLISGKPLNEPVAWWGPIVMNTNEELDTAFKEYDNGTFIKK